VKLRPDSTLVNAVHAAANHEPRRGGAKASILLLHYTGMRSAAKAVEWLATSESRVSCHYVIDEAGHVTQLVAESQRAWHAGKSFWAGETDINSISIGIEIQNPGHEMGYPEFPSSQVSAVIALSADIMRRNRIRPARVLAHSDVAPARKIDPGEKFPWIKLARAGVGHWVRPSALDDTSGRASLRLGRGSKDCDVLAAQELLARYGYDIDCTGHFDEKTYFAVRAFQLHFRPARVDCELDRSTLRTLERLLAALPATADV
jgi:N-acetylmuramoyl-L-alanine amidase